MLNSTSMLIGLWSCSYGIAKCNDFNCEWLIYYIIIMYMLEMFCNEKILVLENAHTVRWLKAGRYNCIVFVLDILSSIQIYVYVLEIGGNVTSRVVSYPDADGARCIYIILWYYSWCFIG